MRSLHRWIMTFAALFMLYLAVTGLLMQGVDFFALLHPTASNAPDLLSIKEYAAGPPYFSILSGVNERAATLPEPPLPQQMAAGFAAARAALPGAPITSIELRVQDGVTQAVVVAGSDAARRLTLNADSGALLDNRPALEPPAPQSTHDAIKDWHRGNIIGETGVWFNLACGVALLVLCVSGIWIYWQMLQRRQKIGRRGFFWS